MPRRILVLILLAASWVVPLFTRSEYTLHILITIGIFIILTLGWVTVMRTGQISLGHAGFWAIGAYASALLTVHAGLSFWLALPLSALLAMIVSILFGYVVLRVRGLYFALTTLAFGEVVRLLAINWPLLGGYSGITHIPAPDRISFPGLPELQFGSKASYYYLLLLMIWVTLFIFYRLHRCRFGRVFPLIWRNEDLAESLGISTMRYKMLSFSVGCLFAGLAGSYYAHYMHFISPEFFTIQDSLYIQVFGIVGGLEFAIAGPIVGVSLLIGATELFRFAKEFQPLFYGSILVLVIMLLPRGIISLVSPLPEWASRLVRAWGGEFHNSTGRK